VGTRFDELRDTAHVQDLLQVQDLFGAQAFLKGGIGNFVCQGLSKRGHSSNPHSAYFSPNNTLRSLRQELHAHGAGNVENVDESEEIFKVPAFEHEHFKKDGPFQTAGRSTRTTDHACKWAAMSFFETDPNRVKHHMEILEGVEQMQRLDALVAQAALESKRTAV
jgi:hypothetical protein